MQDQTFYTTVHTALNDCIKIIDSLHMYTNHNSQRISLLTELKSNLHYSLGKSAYLLPFVQVIPLVDSITQVKLVTIEPDIYIQPIAEVEADVDSDVGVTIDLDVQQNIITALVEKLLQIEYNLDDKLQDLLLQEQTVIVSLDAAVDIKKNIVKKYSLTDNNEETDAYINLAESRELKTQSALQIIRDEIMVTRIHLNIAHQKTSAVQM